MQHTLPDPAPPLRSALYPPFLLHSRRWLLVLRGVLGFLAVSFLYWSVSLLPLSMASTLSFISPIFVAALRCGCLPSLRPTALTAQLLMQLGSVAPPCLARWHCAACHCASACRQCCLAPATCTHNIADAHTCNADAALPSPRSPIILGEQTSRALFLGIAVALAGVLLVVQPPFLFGGQGGNIR